jgi:hypothetical protein
MAVSEEIETELANVKSCPAPCDDGSVLVSPPSGEPRRVRCPVASHYCGYGIALGNKLDAWLNKTMLGAGVPRRHIGNFDGHFETEALTWARKWSFHGFLVLIGASGIGKSFGAAWAVKEYLRSRIPDPLDARTWNRSDTGGENVMWRSANKIIHDRKMASSACDRALLVLDDLGREGDAQIRRADIGDVISARYDARLPTVITTELPFSDIIKTYGLYAAHKLAEDSEGNGGMIADCGGEPVRPENYCGEEDNGKFSEDPDDDKVFYREAEMESEAREPEDVD